MGYEVYVFLYRQQYVTPVLFSDGRQVDMHAGHVDTLMRTKHAVVLHLRHDGWPVDADDFHVNGAVVKQDIVAYVYVVGEILV